MIQENFLTDGTITPYKDFKFWFIRTHGDFIHAEMKLENGTWKDAGVWKEADFEVGTGPVLSPFAVSTELSESEAEELHADWGKFVFRPEYVIGKDIDTENDIVDTYEFLLAGACLILSRSRGVADPDTAWPSVWACLQWLRGTDFYTCPASTRYHDSCQAGLLTHTLTVAARAVELRETAKFKETNLASTVLVALVHDWCKIGLYETFWRNVKNETTGQWEKVPGYKHKDHAYVCLGHGVSSMFLAQRFFKLTLEEACAIRWHMGEYNVADNEMNELHQANESYPLVQLLQFADRLSIVTY